MKLNGVEVKGLNEIKIVLPRGEDKANWLVFTARAIADWSEFHALCPEPKPRVKILPGGKRELQADDPGYKKRQDEHSTKRLAWIVLASLRATPNLTWELVDLGKPDTWHKFEDEFKEAGIAQGEIWKIINTCMNVNALSEDMLDKARAEFVTFQEEQAAALFSLEEEPDSTTSGEPANASE